MSDTSYIVQIDPIDGPNATNLVPDPSFEYDTVGVAPSTSLWVTSNATDLSVTGTFAVSNAWSSAGDQSLHMIGIHDATSNSSSAGAVSPVGMIPGTAGLTYSLSAVFNVLQAPSGGVFVSIAYLNSGNTQLSQSDGTLMGPATTGIYTATVTGTAPANTASLRVLCRFSSHTANQTMEAYVDSVILTQTSSVLTYFDGDNTLSPASQYAWTGTPGGSSSTRTNLRATMDLNNGPIQVGGDSGTGIDWGDAAIQTYEATQQWGQPVVDYRVPNRTVTIPIALGVDGSSEEAARTLLNQKIGLLQREGGWLLRQRKGGLRQFSDIVNATLTTPDVWGEAGNIEPGVQLVLECLPDFYGDEITLDSASQTGYFAGQLTDSGSTAVIPGDYPGRVRVSVTDTSGNNQNSVIWGFRSRHFDSSATAQLKYEAEAMTPLNGAVVTGLSGASGNVVKFASLPAASWTPFLATDVSGVGSLSHQGSYSVWVRAFSAGGTPNLRFSWGAGSLASPTTNTQTDALPASGAFYLMNLGNIRIDPPPLGTNAWTGVLSAYSSTATDIEIDEFFFQPLDEAAGTLNSVQSASAGAITAGPFFPTTAADVTGVGSITWSTPTNIEVDDGVSATAAVGTSHYLEGTNYGFSIPTSATIAGIQVNIKRFNAKTGTTDNRVRLVKAGAIQTTDRALTTKTWPNALAYQSYGGPTDLWGGTWAASDINNSAFGAVLSAVVSSGVANVDTISITVYYTIGSFGVSQDVVVAANGNLQKRYDGFWRQDPGGGNYGQVTQALGDLPRIPPSGSESRPVQLIVKPSRGDLNSVADSGLDAFTVQVYYRPCWLDRP